MRLVLLVLGLVLGLHAAPLAQGAAQDDEIAVAARNLAENILGKGTVRQSRASNGGRTLAMVWESATYKAANPPTHTRELLLAEVQLASGAIFRILTSVRDLQFEIVQGSRSLCKGSAWRDRSPVIAYASDLGN